MFASASLGFNSLAINNPWMDWWISPNWKAMQRLFLLFCSSPPSSSFSLSVSFHFFLFSLEIGQQEQQQGGFWMGALQQTSFYLYWGNSHAIIFNNFDRYLTPLLPFSEVPEVIFPIKLVFIHQFYHYSLNMGQKWWFFFIVFTVQLFLVCCISAIFLESVKFFFSFFFLFCLSLIPTLQGDPDDIIWAYESEEFYVGRFHRYWRSPNVLFL